MPQGVLYGVSVGTGDPELITVKGLKRLQNTKIIAFPAGIGDQPGIAEQITKVWLQKDQQLLKLHFPYVQEESILEQAWNQAAEQVWYYLAQGEDVTFLCEGDVNFYSTFNYLALTLRQKYAGIEIHTIPGVCSPMAAAAALEIPLSKRQEKLAILPALYSVEELEKVMLWADILVLMKFRAVYQQIWQFLAQKNLLSQSCIVERCSFPDQIIYRDLSERPDLKLSYFSIMIVRLSDR
jgi:precorrin-2/cobalt-factor-2 C20-methyltransferase